MKKVLFIFFVLLFTVNVFAENKEYEQRVESTIDLFKDGKIEEGFTNLLGVNSLLYKNVFGTPEGKSGQIANIQSAIDAYGKILGCELVWSKSAGKVTNQWYMIYHENYPTVLDIVFYEINGNISVIKYNFEETAESIPASLDK